MSYETKLPWVQVLDSYKFSWEDQWFSVWLHPNSGWLYEHVGVSQTPFVAPKDKADWDPASAAAKDHALKYAEHNISVYLRFRFAAMSWRLRHLREVLTSMDGVG